MGVELPRNSRELLPVHGMTPVGRSGDPSLWWIAALAVLLVAYAPLLEAGTNGATVLLPLGGTFLAILAWGHAARRAAAMARAACRAFQGAAAVALLAYLAWGYQTRAGVVTPVPMAALHVLPDILVVLGAALVLGRHRGRTWNPRLAADALLFLLVATAGALRLVVEPALAAAPA
ncbi:MAG: hypothetical protein ACLFRX_09690, partial [Gemmatimonadota bacterium]